MPNQLSADLVVVGDIKTIRGGQLSRAAVLPVTYQNKASAATGPTIPAGATLTGINVIVTTQSNDSGTATLAVGWVGGAGTELVAAQDVKSAASAFPQTGHTVKVGTTLTATRQLQAQYSGTSATAGTFLVLVSYVTV